MFASHTGAFTKCKQLHGITCSLMLSEGRGSPRRPESTQALEIVILHGMPHCAMEYTLCVRHTTALQVHRGTWQPRD